MVKHPSDFISASQASHAITYLCRPPGLAKSHSPEELLLTVATVSTPAPTSASAAAATMLSYAADVAATTAAAAGFANAAAAAAVSATSQHQPGLFAPSERTGLCGTSWYMAPEIANGWARYDEKVRYLSAHILILSIKM